MSGTASVYPRSVSRRSYIAAFTGGCFTFISGCNHDSKAGSGEPAQSQQLDSEDEEFRTIRMSLEEIYEAINRFPISNNGEFVFDVQEFEANCNYEDILEETRTIQGRLEEFEPQSDTELEALRSVAKVAELRIQARFYTHQAIAAGLSYGNSLSGGGYHDATDAIQHGRRFLEELMDIIRDINTELENDLIMSVSVDEFEPASIQTTQSVLLEIVQWSSLIFRSFEYASVGFDLFEEGAKKIEAERVDEARKNFESASVHFTNAQKVFQRAHGTGRRLGYIVPLVREIRCVLPIYRDTSERFADSFSAWRSGDEDEARKIARDVIDGIDQRMAQCDDSDSI